MFQVGEYVVYGSKGVCKIVDIAQLDIAGADRERFYYVMEKHGDAGGRIYAPTDNPKVVMRRVITKEDARQLIREMPQIELLLVPDDKQREAANKEALKSGDYRSWVSVVKTLHVRQRERLAQGKKVTALDERYMRAAENELYNELSLTLEVPKDEMEAYIREQLQVSK